jgi:8-oxo-dGTP pyrophosphatase MutT (NUDIX family)
MDASLFNPNPSGEVAPLIPAATVILLRENEGRLETLMLRRNRSLKAFGGAWVFPGGRVDEADHPDGDEVARARHAARREAMEETGLDVSIEGMVSLSRWIPPVTEKRRFSTWFFVAKAPDAEVKIDDGEIHDFQWVCPKHLVANTPKEGVAIMPPTYISLFELSKFNCIDDALSTIHSSEDEFFETRFFKSDSGFVTTWAPDPAFETGDLEAKGPRRRLECGRESWTYLKDN